MNAALFIAIGAGLLSALPLALAVSQPGGMFLLLLAPLPLFAIGLSQGLVAGLIAGGSLLLVATFLAGLLAALAALIFVAGPTLLLVRQALLNRPAAVGAGAGAPGGIEWYPPGHLTTWLVWIGLVWLAISLAMLATQGPGLEASVRTALEETLTASLLQADPALVAQVAERMAAIALGFGVASWLLMLALNGVLAQGLLVRFARNLRPSPDIASIELPAWIAPVLAIVLAAAFLAPGDFGFVAKNVAPLLLLPFFFAGLAVTHAFLRRTRAAGLLLFLFYLLLVLFTWPAVVVVFLGLLDQWANLRRRMTAAPGQEEE